ncbi:MAG: type III secretion system export apparatus subunit SctR [Pseudomonadota bacterium]
MDSSSPALVSILIVSIGLGFLTFMVIAATSFIKLSVVLFIVRNALGIQQTPPNLVLYAIALSLTLFISAPMITAISQQLQASRIPLETTDDWVAASKVAQEPVVDHLMRFTTDADRNFFLQSALKVWPEDRTVELEPDNLMVLIPSFMVAELTRAFQIGFLLYLPFVVIDLVITTILMAMGMAMVSPALLSTPLKLFLFVSVEGWTRLVQGLVLSYA